VLLLLPGILSFIRLDWVETIVSYLPLPASSALLTTGAVETQGAYLSTQASLIVMAALIEEPERTPSQQLDDQDDEDQGDDEAGSKRVRSTRRRQDVSSGLLGFRAGQRGRLAPLHGRSYATTSSRRKTE
jgi:hypothetical protein